MAIRVNPKLIDELGEYGAQDVSLCYHCGNCSATCPFSKGPYIVPRRSMRLLQMGLEKKLETSLEPWLCYYCGDCVKTCPRGAVPGETMMALRRWLITRYDVTTLSKRIYDSRWFELGLILTLALATGVGFLVTGFIFGDIHIYDGPNAFVPTSGMHWFLRSLLVLLGLTMFAGGARMWWWTTGRNRQLRVPPHQYLLQAYQIPFHYFTQKRYSECSEKRHWMLHLPLMLSYFSMLVLIEVFLENMQSGPSIDWRVHVFGYLASVGLLGTCVWFIFSRIRKKEVQYQRSHRTDWTFLVLLLLVTVTGILQHVFHRSGLPMAANIIYVAHVMSMVPLVAVGILSKWSHILYRPLSMYLQQLHLAAYRRQEKTELVPVPALVAKEEA